MRNFFKTNFDVRRERFWRILLFLGVLFRAWNVMFFRNPMSLIFSDAGRHWDNAKHFLNPGPMGASNPYLYQLFLYVAQIVTHENKTGMGLVALGLSLLYPLFWYLLAKQLMRRRINALRFATVLMWLPTHVSMFSFFMNESLLFPLLGAAFWASAMAAKRRAWGWFVLASALWIMAALTRSVVLPIGGLTMLWVWWRQPRKVVTAVLAVALLSVGYYIPSKRAYPLLHRYTPFGDNATVSIYFYSAAHAYSINYIKRGTYIYASPSLYISPFEPFYEFKSARKGTFSYTVDADRQGEDERATLSRVFWRNQSKLPRMIWENFIFITFGHSWPDAGKGNPAGEICLWERWIWLPLILVVFYRGIRYMSRNGPAFAPMIAILFTLSLYAAQVALMEGRYRKPIEPVLFLALFWLAEARKAAPAFKGA